MSKQGLHSDFDDSLVHDHMAGSEEEFSTIITSYDKNSNIDVSDSLSMYFSELSDNQLLDADEEKELAYLVQQGDEKARQKMIESNLRLVISVAKRYSSRDVSLSDLIAEGNLGLMQAVE